MTQSYLSNEYIELLAEEMRLRSLLIDPSRPVSRIHFGGASSFLKSQQLSKLFRYIGEYFNLPSNGPQNYSIEIDPRNMSKSKLELLSTMGVTRINIGVQDFDCQVQKAIQCIRSFDNVQQLVVHAREIKFKSIDLDLIYGLPRQTLKSFNSTLKKVISLSPDQIFLFDYAYIPSQFLMHKRVVTHGLPDSGMKLAILKSSIHELSRNGYKYIGMGHFVKSVESLGSTQYESQLQRNFQGYRTNIDTDLIAFGVSSLSHLAGSYIQNHQDISLYKASIEKGQLPILTGHINDFDDRLRYQVIMALTTSFRLECYFIEERFNIDFHEYFKVEIENLQTFIEDGMLEVFHENHKYTYIVTSKGWLFIPCICMVFDKYLDLNESYSKVI